MRHQRHANGHKHGRDALFNKFAARQIFPA
jgi:hypothetical protein